MFYDEHVEHPSDYLYPWRYIEMVPPKTTVLDERPRHPSRVRVDEAAWERNRRNWLALDPRVDPATSGPVPLIREYAHEISFAQFRMMHGYPWFDQERAEYVAMGWYETFSLWWWDEHVVPTGDVPAAAVEQLNERIAAWRKNPLALG